MIHWKANRLLPSLLDGILSRDTELEVRFHTASCARCRKKLSDLERSEELLGRLPSSLVPLEYGPRSYARLAALSRWTDDRLYIDPDRWKLPALGVAGALTIFFLALGVGSWEPSVNLSGATVTLSSLPPDSSYIPSRLR
jgi:anti-sigma factor RsiW